ncbi:CdaR family transcriptional regulator [Cohnella mopanensis]|uniref:CdaR family transcriptional regulator n=1 Tax=Cohnella mopanensis TaxID=2911966 RepID=UPI001EF8366B|nr:sugar diacid recognition domain-containing protein [Cohnella mopanensis]
MQPLFRISETLAQAIVEAAKEVIHHDVNFMNPEGLMIASTDKQRVGTFHQAGWQVYGEGQSIEVTSSEAYIGSRLGINYPVIIDGRRIGVIGISGDPEDCRSLGFLLTKITEVLIREQMLSLEAQSLEELCSAVTRMLVFGEMVDSGRDWLYALQKLGLDPKEKAFVIVLEDRGQEQNRSVYTYSMQDMIRQWNIRLYTYLLPNQYVAILEQSRYSTIVEKIKANDTVRLNKIAVGIGSIAAWRDLALSYRNAHLALQHAISEGKGICEYTSFELGMLLSSIDKGVKQDFATRMLEELTEEEKMFLKTYFQHQLSLKDTASALYVHKNTIQYRLDKIKEKTGLDPRQFIDSVSLYAALLIQDSHC